MPTDRLKSVAKRDITEVSQESLQMYECGQNTEELTGATTALSNVYKAKEVKDPKIAEGEKSASTSGPNCPWCSIYIASINLRREEQASQG